MVGGAIGGIRDVLGEPGPEDDRDYHKAQMLQQIDEYFKVRPEIKEKFKKPKMTETYENVLGKFQAIEEEAFDSMDMRVLRVKDLYMTFVRKAEQGSRYVPMLDWDVSGISEDIQAKVDKDNHWKLTMQLIAIKYKYYLGFGSNPLAQLGYLTYKAFDEKAEDNKKGKKRKKDDDLVVASDYLLNKNKKS